MLFICCKQEHAPSRLTLSIIMADVVMNHMTPYYTNATIIFCLPAHRQRTTVAAYSSLLTGLNHDRQAHQRASHPCQRTPTDRVAAPLHGRDRARVGPGRG